MNRRDLLRTLAVLRAPVGFSLSLYLYRWRAPKRPPPED